MASKFATCAAALKWMAEIATLAEKPDGAEHYGNLERGWNLAGRFFMADGVDESRAGASGQTFEDIEAAELVRFRAIWEADNLKAPSQIAGEFNATCGPLARLQEGVIQAMRTAPRVQ